MRRNVNVGAIVETHGGDGWTLGANPRTHGDTVWTQGAIVGRGARLLDAQR
jgi:hypothetical protein